MDRAPVVMAVSAVDMTLGVPLLETQQKPAPMPTAQEILGRDGPLQAPIQYAPPVGTPEDPLASILYAIEDLHGEVAALRADLASRTLATRLRRAWAWLRHVLSL